MGWEGGQEPTAADEERFSLHYEATHNRRRLPPWIVLAVIACICCGLFAGVVWYEVTKQ